MTLKRKWAGWGDNAPRVRSKGFWKEIPKWNREAEPMVKRSLPGGSRRPRIFPSLMDWLDPKVPNQWLWDFFTVIKECPNLDFLLLSKRINLFWDRTDEILCDSSCECPGDVETWLMQWRDGFGPENVWVGATVEDQKRADERIPELPKIPAKVRFLSVEPLLEPVNLSRWFYAEYGDGFPAPLGINWVIVGGESGPKRRDCGWQAIRGVAEQCVLAGVPVFVKQDCAFKPGQQGRLPDEIWRLKQFPK